MWKSTIRAKACDTARGLLPASTLSNVGIYGTGQAYEMALLRMQAHPLAEVRQYGVMMLEELRKMNSVVSPSSRPSGPRCARFRLPAQDLEEHA